MIENMPTPDTTQFQTAADVKLDYIQRDISKIELNFSAFKNEVISRREYTDGMQALRREITDSNLLLKSEFIEAVKLLKKDIEIPKKIMYGIMGTGGLTVLYALFNMVIKQ